jgi:hypothetical protein
MPCQDKQKPRWRIGFGLIRRSSRPAANGCWSKNQTQQPRRFQFQASVLIPGIAGIPGDASVIRSEEISFFDVVNGVTRDRLEDSMRSIYGASIMRDYVSAKTVYAYPTEAMIARAKVRNGNTLLIALQGELREGEQFAYWIETVENASGKANSGRVVVFEREYLPKLEAELRKREVALP